MAKLIAIDWGTSSFRAYLLDQQGKLLAAVHSDHGILSVSGNSFSQVLGQQLVKFGDISDIPIICSGMITSRQGWLETPYVECPAGVQDLADALVTLQTREFGTIHFVPGVQQLLPEPDIMRGEETQLAGVETRGRHVALLPGTHSKWVTTEDSVITGFSTFMTGDIFKAVLSQTILRAVSTREWSDEDFAAGVQEGYRRMGSGKGLLSTLFQTRVKSILELDPRAGTESYLSGMLIGTEIAEAKMAGYAGQEPVMVFGSQELTRHYITALNTLKVASIPAPQDVSARGLYRIACLRRLLP